MSVRDILEKHFQPAGVMGPNDSSSLLEDLQRHVRLNTVLYFLLVGVLVVILLGYSLVVAADVRTGTGVRVTTMAGAGLTFPVILEFIRRAVREWSEAVLIIRLCERLDGPQVQATVAQLIASRK
jgi:hypothetical protein